MRVSGPKDHVQRPGGRRPRTARAETDETRSAQDVKNELNVILDVKRQVQADVLVLSGCRDRQLLPGIYLPLEW
jgi:hypothetical protein